MLQVFLHVYVPKFRVCLINCMFYQFEHFFSCSVSLTAYENILWIWYNQMTSSIYRLLYKKNAVWYTQIYFFFILLLKKCYVFHFRVRLIIHVLYNYTENYTVSRNYDVIHIKLGNFPCYRYSYTYTFKCLTFLFFESERPIVPINNYVSN